MTLKQIYTRLVDYMISLGINPFWLFGVLGIVGLLIERGAIKNWKTLSGSQRQWHGALIFGDVALIFAALMSILSK